MHERLALLHHVTGRDRSIAAAVSKVDDISFMEMAYFLQKKFALSPPASEVVATRLQDTFHEFDLSAHPSYLAGIPRDILQRLLEANRRGELIQLAVAGYLSYVVADDEQELRLSRTTREAFLTELAYAINVEGKKFTERDLVGYVDEIKRKYDYAVSSLAYVTSFMSKGILFVDGGEVRFTLPFMESYLLAKRLASTPEDALKYFDLSKDNFDIATFALYAEMGASEDIRIAVERELDKCIAEFELGEGVTHILLGNTLKPAMLDDMKRLEDINGRIREFIAEVKDEKDNREAKQKLIDASDRIRRRATEESETTQGSEHKEGIVARLNNASKVWFVAVNLLGAGVENLEATIKRQLIKRILELTVLVIHHWTKAHSEVDFAEMRARCIDDEEVRDALLASGVAKDEIEAKRIAGSLVDLFEFAFLAQPMRAVLGSLCESAREPVLAESLSNVEFTGEPIRLFHGVWLADVDAKKGRAALVASIKSLTHKSVAYFTLWPAVARAA